MPPRPSKYSPMLWAPLLAALIILFAPLSALADYDPLQFMQQLAELGDRSTGSQGYYRAADIVEDAFEKHAPQTDVEIGRQFFQTPVRHHQGSTISIAGGGQDLPINPLLGNAIWPGTVAKPGISGELVYVGPGSLEDMKGKQIKDRVVLMDLKSDKNWLNAANLGAKALIYVDFGEADGAPRTRFEDKFELTPIVFPRFWMHQQRALELFGDLERLDGSGGGPRVTLNSQIDWQHAQGINVYCLIPGSDPGLTEELLVVQAYYDSTVLIPGISPGADEAVSIAELIGLAEHFKRDPPKRPVLLLATGGRADTLAGMREFIWAVTSRTRSLRKERNDLKSRRNETKKTVTLLKRKEPLAPADPKEQPMLNQAIQDQIKQTVEDLNTRLTELRLGDKNPETEKEIKRLADQRLVLRRLGWQSDFSQLSAEDKQALSELIPAMRARAKARSNDAQEQYRSLNSSYEVRQLIRNRRTAACVSLDLGSHGDGLGSFSQGWMYDLLPSVDRLKAYKGIDRVLDDAAARHQNIQGQDLYRGALRPDLRYPWQNYLPERPALAGEVAALAGWPGFSLATVHDLRPFKGTPYDTMDRLDRDFLQRQRGLLLDLIGDLAKEPLPDPGVALAKGFVTLTGRANLLRQGALFPDLPAAGSLVQVYQGPKRYFYSMVDSDGHFRSSGLANRKHTVHKAILETYGFGGDGTIKWAVDKKQSGKEAYRVRMKRFEVETALVMFTCRQTTLFDTLEPRTFNFMWRLELIDARTETEPMRYWYSRLDTWASSIQSIFLEPGAYLKAALSDTILGRKMLLLNASENNPQGRGFAMSRTPTIPATEHQAARDMWFLLGQRITNLEDKGIFNQRIGELRDNGLRTLKEAEKAREDLDYGRFMAKSRESLALASRVYNDVDKTQKDVLFGVLFYVALFIPFAYCVERLAFGYVNIHKRIIAFLAILAATIGVVYAVHPAFQLTYSPMVVILAFFIVGLSVLVSLIIFFRFENEMTGLQRRSKHMKASNISQGKAFGAAFVIGVSNLRRRPVRTILTCATLVILTFTIMNFTAVKSTRELGLVQFSQEKPYEGMLLRTSNWQKLPAEGLAMAEGSFKDVGRVSPRVWLENQDRTKGMIIPVSTRGVSAEATGLVGLGVDEPRVSGLDKALIAGRWFKEGERQALILPLRMAQRLQASPGDVVTMWGMHFTVVGILRPNALENNKDLDGEPITPVVFPAQVISEDGEEELEGIEPGQDMSSLQSRYQHVDGDQTVILPAPTLLGLGGQLKGLAASLDPGVDSAALAKYLSDRFGLMLFHGTDEGVNLHYAADAINYKGMPNVIVPLIIAVLIVLNTMIGSVYERKREIGIYTSVGMAPSHVSFLFIAESLAFAVMSVVAGYLVAQTSAYFLAGTGIWAGMTANYSSLAGVAAMFLVIAVVLVSSIYPSKVAAEIAIPDVNRSWKMPEGQGSELVIMLPFLIKMHEQMCAGGYVYDYYQAHCDISHGKFSTDKIQCNFACPIDKQGLPQKGAPDCFNMSFVAWLAPFDFGVRQRVYLNLCPSPNYEGFLEVQVVLVRESGEEAVWRRLAKSFINDLRKQLLVWRSLEDEAKTGYEDLMRGHLEGGGYIVVEEMQS